MPTPTASNRAALVAALAEHRRTTVPLLGLLANEVESTENPRALAEQIRMLGVCLEDGQLALAENTLWKLLGL